MLRGLNFHTRRTKTLNFLRGLKDGWGGFNVMHIFFIYLQKSPPEERPIVAVILLLLDLMVKKISFNLTVLIWNHWL